jgi:hypothetical protein
MGALYIFNPTTSPLALEINGERAGSIRPCSPAGYKPFATSVNRTHSPEPGKPSFGENILKTTFEADPRTTYAFSFTLPRGYPLEEDVVAFALRDWLILTTPSGNPLKPNPLLIPASPSSHPYQHPQRGENMTEAQATLGNVYVFNYWSEEIEKFTVAGEVVNNSPVEGWSKGGKEEGTKYTPRGITVPRAKPKEEVPGKFGLGEQSLRIEWPSITRKVTVNIPGPEESGINITEDMILLISPHVAILLAPNGHLINEPKSLESV